MANQKISEYPTELLTFGANDLFDVSKLVSTGPDVWDSQKVKYSTLVAAIAGTVDTIYTADGVLTGNRSVDLGTNNLDFTNGNVEVSGSFQYSGGSPATDKVLVSADGFGNAVWLTPPWAEGSGTLNYVSKWTPDGTTLGNSQIFDDGTSVGININTGLGAKLHIKGAGNTSATRSFQLDSSTVTAWVKARDDQKFAFGSTSTHDSFVNIVDSDNANSADVLAVQANYAAAAYTGRYAAVKVVNTNTGANNLTRAFAGSDNYASHDLVTAHFERVSTGNGAWHFTTRNSGDGVLALALRLDENRYGYIPNRLAVGMNTTPAYPLDVNGAANATSYRVGGTAGAAGGTFTTITSITVTNGIVTAISGS